MTRDRRALLLLTLSCLALALLLPAFATQAAEQPSTTAVSPAPAGIPTAEIASRAAEVPTLLRSLTPAPSTQIAMIEKRLPEARAKIGLEAAAAASILRGQPTLDMLQAQQQIWQARRLQTGQWLSVLT